MTRETLPEDACENAGLLGRMAITSGSEANFLWGTDDAAAQANIEMARMATDLWGTCEYVIGHCVLPAGVECPLQETIDALLAYGAEGDD